MDIINLIDRLNSELEKLNNLKNNEIDTRSFFTDNEHFNDTHEEYLKSLEENPKNLSNEQNSSSSQNVTSDNTNFENIEPNNIEKSLTVVTHNYLVVAQNMFKKTIKFSLKAFLLSISLSFLNLFI